MTDSTPVAGDGAADAAADAAGGNQDDDDDAVFTAQVSFAYM